MTLAPSGAAATGSVTRVRVFVDFWNFTLGFREASGFKPNTDWAKLGPWLAQEAAAVAAPGGHFSYEGMHVYLSFNPKKETDVKLRTWAANTLDRFPGVQVTAMERKAKNPPTCPACHASVMTCPSCGASMAGTHEKGVDTAMVTDMIRLAWEDSYNIGVVVSADRDFIPAVQFLDKKGLKMIHAGFPPKGVDLATESWASLDMKQLKVPLRPGPVK